jgi:multimeric flavodoxin WrbA
VTGGADGVRVLGVAGSPRRHGNSESLLESALLAAEGLGATVDRLIVAEEGIAPCRSCNACSLTGACVVSDRMSEIYPRLDAADAVIVASPVYFATVPAVLKALYDRCQPYWARRYLLHQPVVRRRPGALLLVGGGRDPYGHECAVTTTRSVFAVLGVDYSDGFFVQADTDPHTRVSQEALERAARVGADVVGEAVARR